MRRIPALPGGMMRRPYDSHRNQFTPYLLGSALKWWMDPTYGVYSDAGITAANPGDEIQRVINRANGDIYNKITGISGPILREGANGKRYFDFMGDGRGLKCDSPTGLPTVNAARSFAIGVQRTTGGFNGYAFGYGLSSNNRAYNLDVNNTTGARIVGYNNDWDSGIVLDTSWQTVDSVYTGTGNDLRKNSGTAATTSPSAYDTASGPAYFGLFVNEVPNLGVRGAVSHFVLIADAISSGTRESLRSYIAGEQPT